MHLSFKSVCNKEHKGVICNMTSLSNSFQGTCPVGQVLWEELISLVITYGRVEFLSPGFNMLLSTSVAQRIPFDFTKVPPGLKTFGIQLRAIKILWLRMGFSIYPQFL